MKRAVIILVSIAALMPAAVAAASSRAHRASGAAVVAASARAHRATVRVRHTSLGKILVDRQGFTLYMFTADSFRNDKCMTISGCSSVWPALKTRGTPTAGRGVKASRLGTITLADGTKQVTYAGHPLYTYVGDSGPGQTSYVGARQFGGSWYALRPDGKTVK